MSSNRYILFIPISGFIDTLVGLRRALIYAKRFRRILLIDTTRQVYKINFSEYFDVRGWNVPIISDIKEIEEILSREILSVFPNEIKVNELLKGNYHFGWTKGIYALNAYHKFNSGHIISMNPPGATHNVEEDLIVNSLCGGGGTWKIGLRFIRFAPNFAKSIVHEFNQRQEVIGGDYLTVGVRHSDHLSDYNKLYEDNKHILQDRKIHLATDNSLVVDFFKEKKLNIFNFTTFPKNQKKIDNHNYNGYKPVVQPIHYSDVPGDRQLRDLLIDISLASCSDRVISNSKGGFQQAIRDFRKHFGTNLINYMCRAWEK